MPLCLSVSSLEVECLYGYPIWTYMCIKIYAPRTVNNYVTSQGVVITDWKCKYWLSQTKFTLLRCMTVNIGIKHCRQMMIIYPLQHVLSRLLCEYSNILFEHLTTVCMIMSVFTVFNKDIWSLKEIMLSVHFKR